MKEYVPGILKLVIVVVGLVGVVMFDVPGLVASEVQVPVPVADIVTENTESRLQDTAVSLPAFGLPTTVTATVSAQPPGLVHPIVYVPAALNVVIVVVGLVGLVITNVPGLVPTGVHVPTPVASIVTLPPGKGTQLSARSGPASASPYTITAAVSTQPAALVQTK